MTEVPVFVPRERRSLRHLKIIQDNHTPIKRDLLCFISSAANLAVNEGDALNAICSSSSEGSTPRGAARVFVHQT